MKCENEEGGFQIYIPEGLEGAVEDVNDFHVVMGQPVHTELTTPADERIHMRVNLIAEEFEELVESVYPDCSFKHEQEGTLITWGEQTKLDHVQAADALADLVYVCIGAALEFGIDLAAVWEVVHRSNMAKVGPDGEVKRREDGKIIKPDGWTPPDIKKALGLK